MFFSSKNNNFKPKKIHAKLKCYPSNESSEAEHELYKFKKRNGKKQKRFTILQKHLLTKI